MTRERTDFSGKDLRKRDFEGGDFTRADFSGADLAGANFKNANLGGANLRNANLTGCDMYGANLVAADLTEANLKWTDFRKANLRRAIFSSSRSAELARFDEGQLTGEQFIAAGLGSESAKEREERLKSAPSRPKPPDQQSVGESGKLKRPTPPGKQPSIPRPEPVQGLEAVETQKRRQAEAWRQHYSDLNSRRADETGSSVGIYILCISHQPDDTPQPVLGFRESFKKGSGWTCFVGDEGWLGLLGDLQTDTITTIDPHGWLMSERLIRMPLEAAVSFFRLTVHRPLESRENPVYGSTPGLVRAWQVKSEDGTLLLLGYRVGTYDGGMVQDESEYGPNLYALAAFNSGALTRAVKDQSTPKHRWFDGDQPVAQVLWVSRLRSFDGDRPVIEEVLRLRQQHEEGLITADQMNDLLKLIMNPPYGVPEQALLEILSYITSIEEKFVHLFPAGEIRNRTKMVREEVIRTVKRLNLRYRQRRPGKSMDNMISLQFQSTDDSEFFDAWWDARNF